MNWSQLKTILWLRWRLTRNQWTRSQGLGAVIAAIIAAGALVLGGACLIGGLLVGIVSLAQSQPVVVWGVSATGFALAGARRHGDAATLEGLLSLAEVFGITKDEGDERRYVAAPLLGDAILLCMKTARPWWPGMGERP